MTDLISLPLTKYNEQYFLYKKIIDNDINYYIINTSFDIIGKFNVGYYNNMSSMSFNINEEYQNRGIGQIVLNYVINDLFNILDINRIVLLPTNDISKNIVLKNNFNIKRRGIYELTREDYLKNKERSLDSVKK